MPRMNELHPSPAGHRRRADLPVSAATSILVVAGLLAAVPAAALAQGAGASAPEPWQRAEMPFTAAGLDLWDVTAGGPGFVAVGGGYAEGRPRAKALVLTSIDGYRWEAVELAGAAANGSIRAVTATPDGFVAVGSGEPGTAAVWRSADGLAWERLADSPELANALMLDIVSTHTGLVAVGCSGQLECAGGLAWTSPDGQTWSEPVSLDLLPMGIAATSDGLLALGAVQPYGGQAALASSANGTTWAPATVLEPTGSLQAAVQLADGVLAAGGASTENGSSSTLLARSADGQAWQTVDAPSSRLWVEDLVGLPDGWLLVGWETRRGESRPATLLGSDPSALQRIAFPREVKEGGLLHAGAVGPAGETMVVVGSSILNRGSVPTVWVRGPVVDTAG
jgi:hypothetical protein